MISDPKKDLKFYIYTYIAFLLSIVLATFFISCSNSSLLGNQVAPDSTHYSTIFSEIVDQDSVVHWYTDLYEGTNWCYYHHKYEDIKSVRR